ncbi:hypothetical protein [Nocardioides halotolerans]|uniref:hypothetical protein n=1 Tax=Nocardioides halotolerans TaxID=433660 RepID=UPI0004259DF3|nr:hypothetical protein [Nocardioides halotolerans]
MSTSHISEGRRQESRFRAQVARAEHDEEPGLVERGLELVADVLMPVILVVLAVDGWLAYRSFHKDADSPASGSTSITFGATRSADV